MEQAVYGDKVMKIVCLGDSLTVGPGVRRGRKWVTLASEITGHSFINKGISGDTTAGMLARLDRDVIQLQPDMAIVMGGGNDIICGVPSGVILGNFMAIVHQLFNAHIKTLIAAPPPCITDMVPAKWKEFNDLAAMNEEIAWLSGREKVFAETFMCRHADLYSAFLTIEADQLPPLYLDGLHLSEAGHQLAATIICEALKNN